jgi:predicted nuclease of predicted toxin-antitoxin system
VKSENLINAPDREIWEFAKNNDYIIVTQDSDFNDLNSLYGFPPKLIWIRTGNLKTSEIVKILMEYLNEIIGFIDNSDYGCFEIFKFKG